MNFIKTLFYFNKNAETYESALLRYLHLQLQDMPDFLINSPFEREGWTQELFKRRPHYIDLKKTWFNSKYVLVVDIDEIGADDQYVEMVKLSYLLLQLSEWCELHGVEVDRIDNDNIDSYLHLLKTYVEHPHSFEEVKNIWITFKTIDSQDSIISHEECDILC